jgi:hypothetical protein
LDDRFVDADGGREETVRLELVPPVHLFFSPRGSADGVSRLVFTLIFPTIAEIPYFGVITTTGCTWPTWVLHRSTRVSHPALPPYTPSGLL